MKKCEHPDCNNLLEDWDRRRFCSKQCANSSPERRKKSSEVMSRWNNSGEGRESNRNKMISYNKSEEHREVARKLMNEMHEKFPELSQYAARCLNYYQMLSRYESYGVSSVYLYLLSDKDNSICKIGVTDNIDRRSYDLSKIFKIDSLDYWELNYKEALDIEFEVKDKITPPRLTDDYPSEVYSLDDYNTIKTLILNFIKSNN